MAQPLTDAITALTRYANETTGASDTTLSDAVETLVAGYGQGGGGSVSQDAEGYIVLPVDGGANNVATGSFTLDSNFSLTATGGQVIPNFQMPFQPDVLLWIISKETWENLTPSGAHLYGMLAVRKDLLPYMIGAVGASNDYCFFSFQNITATDKSPSGYVLSNPATVSESYYPRFSVNADGTVSVGRFSSSSSNMYAGTYVYYGMKV